MAPVYTAPVCECTTPCLKPTVCQWRIGGLQPPGIECVAMQCIFLRRLFQISHCELLLSCIVIRLFLVLGTLLLLSVWPRWFFERILNLFKDRAHFSVYVDPLNKFYALFFIDRSIHCLLPLNMASSHSYLTLSRFTVFTSLHMQFVLMNSRCFLLRSWLGLKEQFGFQVEMKVSSWDWRRKLSKREVCWLIGGDSLHEAYSWETSSGFRFAILFS